MQAERTETLKPAADIAIEITVLGAMMMENGAVGVALTMLHSTADVFHVERHRHIFRAILALYRTGDAVDILTVTNALRENGKLEQSGGAKYLAGFVRYIHNAASISTHCAILLDLYAKRRTVEIAHELLRTGHDLSADAGDVLANAQKHLTALFDIRQQRRAQRVGELLDGVVERIVAATTAPGGITGVPTGLAALDGLTGGWQPGNLIIVAGRPGMGKTSFMLATGRNAAGFGHAGEFVSLEMSMQELVTKLIATELHYTTSQLTRGMGMSADEARGIGGRVDALRGIGLLLDDTPGLTVDELRAKATKAKQDDNIAWLAVDYLQLMRGAGGRGQNREQEVAEVSRGLKLIAKELNIPVIAGAQLSRAVEGRGADARPKLSDLRESGGIEQDADVVLFLHRPEYYGVTQDAAGGSTAGLTELIIAKHRNGSTATGDDALLVYSKMATGRYSDLEKDKPFEVPAGNFRALPKSDFENLPF